MGIETAIGYDPLLQNGLIAYYAMEKEWIDSTSNNLNLTAVNNPTQTTGIIGKAVSLVASSSQALQLNDNSLIDFTQNFTASCWFNATTFADFSAIIGKMTYASSHRGPWGLFLGGTGLADNTDLLILVAQNSADSSGAQAFTTGLNLVSGTWYHAVLTYDGTQSTNAGKCNLYVNGVQQSLSFNGTMPATLLNQAIPFSIGIQPTQNTYWNGLIDEVSLWNITLNQFQVNVLYNSGIGITYPFGDSSTANAVGLTASIGNGIANGTSSTNGVIIGFISSIGNVNGLSSTNGVGSNFISSVGTGNATSNANGISGNIGLGICNGMSNAFAVGQNINAQISIGNAGANSEIIGLGYFYFTCSSTTFCCQRNNVNQGCRTRLYYGQNNKRNGKIPAGIVPAITICLQDLPC